MNSPRPPVAHTLVAMWQHDFVRFVISGGIATVANLASVEAARRHFSFEQSVGIGIAVAVTCSFLLTKFFAFRSRELHRTRGELARFLAVYTVGLLVYGGTAFAARAVLLAAVPEKLAEPVAVLIAAATMTVTGYFGHRYFTYRTWARGK